MLTLCSSKGRPLLPKDIIELRLTVTEEPKEFVDEIKGLMQTLFLIHQQLRSLVVVRIGSCDAYRFRRPS
jgi:hypothetical protein